MTPSIFAYCTMIISSALGQTSAPANAASSTGIQDANAEIIRQLKEQPVGGVTLGAYCLPDAFLGRVADRIVRIDFQRRFRSVHVASTQTAPGASAASESHGAGQSPPGSTKSAAKSKGVPIAVFSGSFVVIMIAIARWRLRQRQNP